MLPAGVMRTQPPPSEDKATRVPEKLVQAIPDAHGLESESPDSLRAETLPQIARRMTELGGELERRAATQDLEVKLLREQLLKAESQLQKGFSTRCHNVLSGIEAKDKSWADVLPGEFLVSKELPYPSPRQVGLFKGSGFPGRGRRPGPGPSVRGCPDRAFAALGEVVRGQDDITLDALDASVGMPVGEGTEKTGSNALQEPPTPHKMKESKTSTIWTSEQMRPCNHSNTINDSERTKSASNDIRGMMTLFHGINSGAVINNHTVVLNKKNRGSLFMESYVLKDLDFQALTDARFGSGSVKWHELPSRFQAEIIRNALKSSVCHINPESRYMRIWDLILFACLFFTAVVTPVEISFLKPEFGTLFVLNRIVEVLFLKDMTMNFFLKDPRPAHATFKRSSRDLVKTYMRGWFIVDFLALLPYEYLPDLVGLFLDDAPLGRFKAFELLRFLRLIKLTRLGGDYGLLARWQNNISSSCATQRLWKFTAIILLTCHWLACIWGFVGVLEGTNLVCKTHLDPGDPLLTKFPDGATYFFRHRTDDDGLGLRLVSGESWVVKFAFVRAAGSPVDPCNPAVLYTASLYWAVMTLTSIGYGDILPITMLEYVLCIAAMLVTSSIWAYLIGSICTLLYGLSPESWTTAEFMDAFNRVAKEQQIPKPLCKRARECIRQSQVHAKYVRSMEATKSLTLGLRASIIKHMASHYLGAVPHFEGTSDSFQQEVAALLVPHFYERQEVFELRSCLCIVEHGTVLRGGCVHTRYGNWGQDVILSEESLRLRLPAKCLTYTEVLSLHREDLVKVLGDHPKERRRFRRSAIRLAMVRATTIIRQERKTRVFFARNAWIHELFGLDNDVKTWRQESTE